MSPEALQNFLENNCELREQGCWNKVSNRIIKACMPMHTFGFPCDIQKIKKICDDYRITLVEDSAESIGSFYKGTHTGTFGDFGVLSFNGNKIITTGAGGIILTNNEKKAALAKHITTTAKLPHKWDFNHDMPAYNYRMANLNASIGLSQIKKLPFLLKNKRAIASQYKSWGEENGYFFIQESPETTSNYWLNTLIVKDKKERDMILEETNKALIMTRPAWTPMHKLPFNTSFQRGEMTNTNWLFDRIINVPSSVPKNAE
jgi:dTDP-4-amino-4,6-dideoxygalactose transaminase